MTNWNEEYFIEKIQKKLCEQQPLNENEIRTVITALRKAHNYTQTPYYEIVYHDEYDRQERRIMNPTSHSCGIVPGNEEMLLTSDGFEIHFNRIVPRNGD